MTRTMSKVLVAAVTKMTMASSVAWRNRILRRMRHMFSFVIMYTCGEHVSAPDCQHRRVGLGNMSMRLK